MLHGKDIRDQLPNVRDRPIAVGLLCQVHGIGVEGLLHQVFVPMIQGVLVSRGDGHRLEPQHHVLPSLHVVLMPDIHQVGILAVEGERDDEIDRPGDWGVAAFVLPPLLLRAVGYAERPDESTHNVLEIRKVVLCSVIAVKAARIQVVKQLIPLAPKGRVIDRGAYLHAGQ